MALKKKPTPDICDYTSSLFQRFCSYARFDHAPRINLSLFLFMYQPCRSHSSMPYSLCTVSQPFLLTDLMSSQSSHTFFQLLAEALNNCPALLLDVNIVYRMQRKWKLNLPIVLMFDPDFRSVKIIIFNHLRYALTASSQHNHWRVTA